MLGTLLRAGGSMRRLLLLLLTITTVVLQAADRRYALRGTLILPDRVVVDGCVVVDGERITAIAAPSEVASGIPTIDTAGSVLPSFIDFHNHRTRNSFLPLHPRAPTKTRD